MSIQILINKYKSIGLITSSLIVGAVITFTALPFLTRLYGVKDFGEYGMTLAIVSVFSTIANLRLDQALLIAKENDKKSLIFEGIFFSLIFCILSAAILSFFFSLYIILAISSGVLANTLIQSIYNYKFAQGQEIFCAVLNIFRNLVVVSVQLILPLYMNIVLVSSYSISSMIIILLLILYILKYRIYQISWLSFKNYRDFIFSNTPHALLNSFSHNIPYYIVSHFLGYQVVGFYSIVERTLRLPINLMSQTIRQFFIRKFRTNSSIEEALKSSTFLSLVSLPFFCIFFLLPESLYIIIFGVEWNGISKYFKILALGYWAVFCNPPIAAFLIAKRKSNILLKLQIMELLIKLFLFWIIYQIFDNKNLILYAVPLSLIFYNLSIYLAVRRMKKC